MENGTNLYMTRLLSQSPKASTCSHSFSPPICSLPWSQRKIPRSQFQSYLPMNSHWLKGQDNLLVTPYGRRVVWPSHRTLPRSRSGGLLPFIPQLTLFSWGFPWPLPHLIGLHLPGIRFPTSTNEESHTALIKAAILCSLMWWFGYCPSLPLNYQLHEGRDLSRPGHHLIPRAQHSVGPRRDAL